MTVANDPFLLTTEELVNRSSVIVVAKQDEPAWHHHEIIFFGRSKENVLPYKQTRFHYKVSETLLGDISSGSSIEIIEADTSMHQTEHYNYHAEKMTMSIAWQRYAQKYETHDGEPGILFLQQDNDGLSFIVQGGFEGIQALDEVRVLIEKSHRSRFF